MGVESQPPVELPDRYRSEPADSALRGDRRHPAFPSPIIDPDLIVSGGVAPDAITPIDIPRFVAVEQVDFLDPNEAVVVVVVGDDARAYPIQILVWHEIVNDVVGGLPVTVTYCPLCNSSVAIDRRLGERVLDFGTSGQLYQSALVMYDRQTESLWAHFTAQALVGHYAGVQLRVVPSQMLSFGRFAQQFPDGKVLEPPGGSGRVYGLNPYIGYDDEQTQPIAPFIRVELDDRLPAKRRVIGIDRPGQRSVAVLLADPETDGEGVRVVEISQAADRDAAGGSPPEPLVVFQRAGLHSPLERATTRAGRDVGQTGVFVPRLSNGTILGFEVRDGRIVDRLTGSQWAITGQAVSGPLEGAQLHPVPHLNTFWFAWSSYHPDTVVVDP